MAKKQNPLRTVGDLRRWIQANVDLDRNDPLNPKPWTTGRLNRAILWWFALEEADSMADLSRKDIASLLLHGQRALTLRDVQALLNELHESDDDSDPAAQQLEANLRAHFDPGPGL